MEDFVAVCDRVASTRSKLAKIDLLAGYLGSIPEDDLPVAARFLTGAALTASGQAVLGIGHASLRNVVCRLARCSHAEFAQALLSHGDMGDACGEVLEGRLLVRSQLSLAALWKYFERLALTPGTARKEEILEELLSRCSPGLARLVAKIITSELRIGAVLGLVEEAIARLGRAPVEQVRRTHMLLGDIGETAQMAAQGRLAEARLRLFHPLGFMLASPATNASQALALVKGRALVEDKYDGVRAQVHKQGGRIAIYSRTLDEVSYRFPELSPDILRLGGEFVLDGEIAAYQEGKCMPFRFLQKRLGRKIVSERLLDDVPVAFFAFDILYQDGLLLLDEELRQRRARLDALELNGRLIRSLMWEEDDAQRLEDAFLTARARGNEGLMVKGPSSPYTPGRRGQYWLKLKRPSATLDVVVTAVEWGHGKRRNVLSDYTFAVRDGEELKNIGKAYSGLTDAEIASMTVWFKSHTLTDFGWGRVVEPAIVLEVAFDVIQRSSRHQSGYALRFPRILRLRPDKGIVEISTLDEVRQLAESMMTTERGI